jgi:hypothetical protein
MRIIPLLLLAASAFAADWKIAIKPTGALKSDADVPIEVRVSDAKGAAVAGAEVELVLTMVDMDHGEFKHPAKQSQPGVYTGNVKFIMSGGWNVEARVKKGSDSAKAKQKVDVK